MVSSRGGRMKDERELSILVGLHSPLTSWPFLWLNLLVSWKGFPGGSAGKESACNVGDLGLIAGLGRSPGEGKGYPLQYSGLENSIEYIIHGVAKSFCANSQKVFGHMLQSCWTQQMVSWKGYFLRMDFLSATQLARRQKTGAIHGKESKNWCNPWEPLFLALPPSSYRREAVPTENSCKVKVKLLSYIRLFATPWTIYSLPGSTVHGIFQARILEWVAISFSRRSSWPRDWTQVSRIVGRHFTIWATREVLSIPGPQSNHWLFRFSIMKITL